MVIIANNEIMSKVEAMVCEQVSKAMQTQERDEVSLDDIYDGVTNIPFGRAVARNFIFDVLHNRYCFSFSVIAQRADMNRESVMRCVRKCHELLTTDRTYSYVNTLINDRFREWYGE